MDARGRIMPDVRTDFQLNVWPPPTNYLHRGAPARFCPARPIRSIWRSRTPRAS